MGSSYDTDEGPREAKMCYNPAKSYQLGWYDQHSPDIFPLTTSFSGKLVGVSRYDSTTQDEHVVLKLDGGSADDVYIGYNHAIGFHEGTVESVNKVTVVHQGSGNAKSYKVASLGTGGTFQLINYLGSGEDITIKVMDIDTGSNGYAHVFVYKSDECGECCLDNDCPHSCATGTCQAGTCSFDPSTCPGGTFPPTQPPTEAPYPTLVFKGDNGNPSNVYPLQECESGKIAYRALV